MYKDAIGKLIGKTTTSTIQVLIFHHFKSIPLFVKIRNRLTKHGGHSFNPLDFLSD